MDYAPQRVLGTGERVRGAKVDKIHSHTLLPPGVGAEQWQFVAHGQRVDMMEIPNGTHGYTRNFGSRPGV